MKQEWTKLFRQHLAQYPQMEPQDMVKLIAQSVWGPGHLGLDQAEAEKDLCREWKQVPADASPRVEPIGNGLCRFYLWGNASPLAAGLLAHLLVRTAEETTFDPQQAQEALSAWEEMQMPAWNVALHQWQQQGFPMMSHSAAYKTMYAPHYRVIRLEYAQWFFGLLPLWEQMQTGRPMIVALDGRCGSGKTTLAQLAERVLGYQVFHMDDYYLPLGKRDPDWEQQPAGNMDLERFRTQVLEPARTGQPVRYRPYRCQLGAYAAETVLSPAKQILVEGSYCLHPALRPYYDETLFLTCTPAEQQCRLQAREGDYYPMFRVRWIPMEERYYTAYHIPTKEECILDTTDFLVQQKR